MVFVFQASEGKEVKNTKMLNFVSMSWLFHESHYNSVVLIFLFFPLLWLQTSSTGLALSCGVGTDWHHVFIMVSTDVPVRWRQHISQCLACTLAGGSSLLTQVNVYNSHTFFFSFWLFSCYYAPFPTQVPPYYNAAWVLWSNNIRQAEFTGRTYIFKDIFTLPSIYLKQENTRLVHPHKEEKTGRDYPWVWC